MRLRLSSNLPGLREDRRGGTAAPCSAGGHGRRKCQVEIPPWCDARAKGCGICQCLGWVRGWNFPEYKMVWPCRWLIWRWIDKTPSPILVHSRRPPWDIWSWDFVPLSQRCLLFGIPARLKTPQRDLSILKSQNLF